MNKIILVLTLTILSCSSSLAQDIECMFCHPQKKTKTEASFNATYVNHRHIVTLEKGNKMVIEMFNIKDYEVLDTALNILKQTRQALHTFKDSMQTTPSGHLRVDYSYATGTDYRKIRVKKYDSDGSVFLDKNGEISHLKVEQDTIRILIHKRASYTYEGTTYKNHRPVQLTFVLNNYTDIDSIITDYKSIQHFIDTMKSVATPKYKVNQYDYKTTINFHPYDGARERYSGKFRFIFYEGILTNEYSYLIWDTKFVFPRTIGVVAEVGAGLLGENLATMAELGLEYRFRRERGSDFVTITSLNAAPYFTYGKNAAGNITVFTHLFVNAELGSLAKQNDVEHMFTRSTIGIGYLAYSNSNYLPGTTMKAFFDFRLKSQFVICPEVIFTNNFKTVFPALTFKGFLNRY